MQKPIEIPDLIRLLPFSEDFRKNVIAVYPDKLTSDKRVILERHLWQVYYAYFDLQYEINMEELIRETDGLLPEGYHDMLLEKTNAQIDQGLMTQKTSTEIDQLRTQLQQLVSVTQ